MLIIIFLLFQLILVPMFLMYWRMI